MYKINKILNYGKYPAYKKNGMLFTVSGRSGAKTDTGGENKGNIQKRRYDIPHF